MKKILLLMILACLLTGCADGKENNKKTETIKEDSSSGEAVSKEVIPEDETENAASVEEDKLTFSHAGITVTVPDTWKGKVLVQENEDGLSFFQKSSYEKEEGLGFLYGFYKSDTMIDESTGATEIAYTDDFVYYIQQPTDVSYYYEDDGIAAEYTQMMEDDELLLRSFQVEAEGVHYDAREYILPLSYIKPVQEELLYNMTADELWIARNEIFARHGRKFTNPYLDAYFASCSWYTPSVEGDSFDESVLSSIEKDNIEVIQAQENIRKAERPYPQKMSFGTEYTLDLDGNGKQESLRADFTPMNEYGECSISITIDGDMVTELGTTEPYICNLNTDNYYITDISPHFDGLEMAFLDYGPSEDYETYFFRWNDGIEYIGSVGGFPFKEEMQLDGFAWDGCVKGVLRTDLIHTCFSYANWFYDYENKSLELQDVGMYTMIPDGGHDLSEDIQVFMKQDVSAATIPLKAQKIFFLETDAKEWIKIKGKDGTVGYIHITDGKIDGIDKNPQEIISGLYFAG